MIQFFRHIRKKLISSNKLGKYLAYALGEILLVVIGILIALSLNNWNDDVKAKKQEASMIQSLNLEFIRNGRELEKAILEYARIKENCDLLLGLFAEPTSELNKLNLDSLISEVIDYNDFNPSQTVLLDITSSGKLNMISSDSLRQDLIEWNTLNEKKKDISETLDQNAQRLMFPYLIKNSNLKNIDRNGDLIWLSKSKFASKNAALFQDPEFENHIDNHLWGIYSFIISLEELRVVADRIIERTSQVNKKQ